MSKYKWKPAASENNEEDTDEFLLVLHEDKHEITDQSNVPIDKITIMLLLQ